MCKRKSCLKPSRQEEEESFSSRVFGGLCVSQSQQLGCCRKAWPRLWGGASRSCRALAGDGKRQEKGKTSHSKPFPCPPQHKALFPLITLCHGSWLSQKVIYPPGTGCEEQWQGTTKGSAPASFPSSPGKGESPLLPGSLT